SGNALAPRPVATRPFAGVFFDGTIDEMHLGGTNGVNVFDTTPSVNTQFFINGNLPAPGTAQPGGGDYLRLETNGTAGRAMHLTGAGAGYWNFTSAHRDVDFQSIERFNHVAISANAVVASNSSVPIINVYDPETGAFRFKVQPYETYFRGGVHTAIADV